MSKFNKETLTFRDLIQAQLDGDTVQCFYGNSWIDRLVIKIDVDSLDDEVDKELYRIKPTKPSINWDHVHLDFKYLARDRYGEMLLFKDKPKLDKSYLGIDYWLSESPYVSAMSISSLDKGTCDWTESLIERPRD